MRQLKVVLLLAPLVLAGCGGWHDLFGSKRSAASQPLNCSRAQLEVIIARAGMACDDSNPCPSGSYCNTSGVCSWACYADSECATGQVCGCDGRCTGDTGSGADGGTPTTNLSCNKDATLLYKIKPGSSPTNIPPDACDASGHCPIGATCDPTSNVCNWVRACDNDERCPAGSYCDPATGNCGWDCQPNVACPDPAQTCDCTGRCVVPGVAPTMGQSSCEARETLTMGVSARTSFLVGDPNIPTFWTRTVGLTLSTTHGSFLVDRFGNLQAVAQTYVVPRGDLQILCNGAYTSSPCPLTLAGFGAPGSTDAWEIYSPGLPVSATTRATLQLQFQVPPRGVVGSGWHADIYTPGAANSPQRLDFTFNTTIPTGSPTPNWQAGPPFPDGVTYQGTMVITGSTDPGLSSIATTTDAVPPASIKVYARSTANSLTIFEPTHTISNSGSITLTSDPIASIYLANINTTDLTLQVHGNPTAQIQVNQDTNALRGQVFVDAFQINDVVAYAGTFSLTPITTNQAVPTIPSEPTAPSTEVPYSGTPHWEFPWESAFHLPIFYASQVESTWVHDVYNYEHGVSTPIFGLQVPFIDADGTIGNYPDGIGKELCETAFIDGYVDALNRAAWVDSNDIPVQATASLGNFEFVDICNDGKVYPPTGERQQDFLPCLDGSETIEGQLKQFTNGNFDSAASCKYFHDNQQQNGRVPPTDYNTWLTQSCFKVNGTDPSAGTGAGIVQFKAVETRSPFTAIIQPTSFLVYLCPLFKEALVRFPNDSDSAQVIADDPTPAEAAYCYEPGHGGAPLLWSGRLSDGANVGNVLPFSGDLLCQDASNQTYVPAMFPLLTHADRAARGEFKNGDPLSASDLLDACISELTAPAPTFDDADLTPDAVIGTVQNVFADANCISLPRFIGALNYIEHSGPHLAIRDQKLLTHFLRQWAQIHSFISYQGLEESKLRRVLASATQTTSSPVATSGPDPGSLPPIRDEDLIDLVNRSWEVFLGEYVGQRPYLSAAVSSPDYRDWSGSLATLPTDWQAHQDQWLPLPITEMEGVDQEMRLLRAYLTDAALAAYTIDPTSPNPVRDQALLRYGTTMRLTYLVEGAASDLYFSGTTTAAQDDRWNTAIVELRGLREDVRRLAGQLSLGHNPLGIDEDDLPIYFGDPAGVNSQYFASSDYLVNQWAIPSVTAAEASITAARDAWLQARNSAIQDQMTQTQRDQRIDDLKATQGQKIIDNCGLTNVASQDVLAAFEGGAPDGTKLDLSSCFIDPACIARSGLNDSSVTARVTPQQVKFTLCTLNQTAGYRQLPQPIAGCAAADDLGTQCQVGDLYQDYNSSLVPSTAAQQAELTCEAQLGYRAPLPTPQDLVGDLDPSCYRGKLGAAALQIISARQDIDIARQNWETAQQTFQLDTTYCEQVEEAEDGAETRAQDLANTLETLSDAKFQADQAAIALDAASSLFSGFGQLLTNPGAAIGGVVSGISGGFKEESLAAQHQMDSAQQQYNEAMAIQQATDTIRTCWHQVDVSQLAIASAFAQIARRGTDALSAAEQFTNAMNENVQALRQGSSDVKREQNRLISTVAFHYWLSEKIDKFDKDFAWAKRMTYLAMRAVEYEFQQSLSLRTAILTASHPDQLQDAINALEQQQGTRTINRRRPSQDSVVLSLRDDVLGLVDHSADPTGERELTPTRGLQQRLTDPRFAVTDKAGNWLGQGIPFSLGPQAALNYRCGERLWRITATVQGDALSEDQPGVSLLVLKRNTFASQWCEGLGDGSKFQYGSLQPNRNLFAQAGTSTPDSEANGFSTALIYPWFNIRRTDFYKETYQDGASEELAGRGLYGDYILLFPRDVLEGTANDNNACVAVKRGFPLDQVEDVLVRFDYLSVDNLPDIQQ